MPKPPIAIDFANLSIRTLKCSTKVRGPIRVILMAVNMLGGGLAVLLLPDIQDLSN